MHRAEWRSFPSRKGSVGLMAIFLKIPTKVNQLIGLGQAFLLSFSSLGQTIVACIQRVSKARRPALGPRGRLTLPGLPGSD